MIRTVPQAFQTLINRQSLTPDQKDLAIRRVQGLTKFFHEQFFMEEVLFSIGSYAKGTLCSGERDIDLMACFEARGQSMYWERFKDDSSRFLYWVRGILNERYSSTDVSSKQVAVTLDFNTIKVDIVPCFKRDGGGYLMPDGRGGWTRTNPRFHTTLINDSDARTLGRLKQLIKLTKAWNHANGHHLKSFHVELMVEAMWKKATNIPVWPEAMKKTIETLPSWIKSPFPDPWDPSKSIDTYLSKDNKEMVLRMLDEDASSSAAAESFRLSGNEERAFERWQVVYRHTFPERQY